VFGFVAVGSFRHLQKLFVLRFIFLALIIQW